MTSFIRADSFAIRNARDLQPGDLFEVRDTWMVATVGQPGAQGVIVLGAAGEVQKSRRAGYMALVVTKPWHVEVDFSSRLAYGADASEGMLLIGEDGICVLAAKTEFHLPLTACSLDGNADNDRYMDVPDAAIFTRWKIVVDQGQEATARFAELLTFDAAS